MATNIIPPVGTVGTYKLHEPFGAIVRPLVLYKLDAIRFFSDIENNGGNVYDLYYKPFGLSQQQVDTDRENKVCILTLVTDNFAPIYVPSSYVMSYPNLDVRPYSQIIMTLSFGPLPTDTIMEPAKTALANAASDFIGVRPDVYVGLMPLSDAITPEEDANREATRQAAIANRTTDYALLREANATIASLTQQIQIYQKICKDNGYIP